MIVRFKKLTDWAIQPYKATKGSAAFDVCIPKNFRVRHGRQIIPIGIAIELPDGYQAQIEPRSGFSSKGIEGYGRKLCWRNVFGIPVLWWWNDIHRFNADVLCGKIDSDYRGCIGVIVKNNGLSFTMPSGTRIAQMTVQKVEDAEFIQVEELSETKRNNGGFGHTGTQV